MLNRLKSLFSKSGTGVAIELGSERINIAQLQKKGAAVTIVHLCSAEVPEGFFEEGRIINAQELGDLVRTTLSQNKITATYVATSVPTREATIKLIPLPVELNDRELRDLILHQEAALHLPYPREEVDLDYQKLDLVTDEDGLDKVQVMLAATRKEVTDSYLETFQYAGLQVKVLEISSFAVLRTIKEQLRQFAPQDAVVLVDIQFDCTEIAIVVNGIPQFNRTVPIGTFQLQEALSSAMNLPLNRNSEVLQEITIPDMSANNIDERSQGMTSVNPGMGAMMRILVELADEVRRSIDFYMSHNGQKFKLEQLLLAGPGGGLGQLDLFFTQRLNIPAIQIDPISGLGLMPEMDIPNGQRPGLAVVLGLGMREI
ncbi:type IV pilus assembly protein PilM [Chamaesiphon sp.]|uniref:type IV pilus assembly protein PilM n=1 Tax=Chamaesiphon sp. TaxID=2814140 RepID=UPI0035937723